MVLAGSVAAGGAVGRKKARSREGTGREEWTQGSVLKGAQFGFGGVGLGVGFADGLGS